MVKTRYIQENGEGVEGIVVMDIAWTESGGTKQQEHGEDEQDKNEEEYELGERGEKGDADGLLVEAVGEDEVECFFK